MTSITETIEFNYNKTNIEANNKIDKDELISLLKKMKNRQLIQQNPYLFHERYSVLIEIHSEITEIIYYLQVTNISSSIRSRRFE